MKETLRKEDEKKIGSMMPPFQNQRSFNRIIIFWRQKMMLWNCQILSLVEKRRTQKGIWQIWKHKGPKLTSKRMSLMFKLQNQKHKNSSLEVLLKEANERKTDITPLKEHTLLLRSKIYQVQVKLAQELYIIKKVESRLKEISVISTEFKMRTQEIAETI